MHLGAELGATGVDRRDDVGIIGVEAEHAREERYGVLAARNSTLGPRTLGK